jgi:hypothetical protein
VRESRDRLIDKWRIDAPPERRRDLHLDRMGGCGSLAIMQGASAIRTRVQTRSNYFACEMVKRLSAAVVPGIRERMTS